MIFGERCFLYRRRPRGDHRRPLSIWTLVASKIAEFLIDIGGLLGFILLHGSFLGALGCLRRACTPPGTLLAGSWEALGRLLEASKKQHEPKTGIVAIFHGFLEK